MQPMVESSDPRQTPVNKREADSLIAQGAGTPSATRTLRCRTVARGRFKQLNYIRDLPPQPMMEDALEGLSGELVAPNASEALLAAFGSCLAVGIQANAVVRGIPLHSLELDMVADVASTAVWGGGGLTPETIGFEAIQVSVRIRADAPRATLEALVRHATLWSPVANTLHNPVHLDVLLEADDIRAA